MGLKFYMPTEMNRVYSMAALIGMNYFDIKNLLGDFDFYKRAQELTLGEILDHPKSNMSLIKQFRLFHYAMEHQNKQLSLNARKSHY